MRNILKNTKDLVCTFYKVRIRPEFYKLLDLGKYKRIKPRVISM